MRRTSLSNVSRQMMVNIFIAYMSNHAVNALSNPLEHIDGEQYNGRTNQHGSKTDQRVQSFIAVQKSHEQDHRGKQTDVVEPELDGGQAARSRGWELVVDQSNQRQ